MLVQVPKKKKKAGVHILFTASPNNYTGNDNINYVEWERNL